MPPIVIIITGREQRNIVNADIDPGVGRVLRRRASHVLPVNALHRLAFRIIRAIVSDDSQVAEWTRGWSVAWRVDLELSGGPVLEPFRKRCDAIAAEVAWLNENNLGETP